MHKKLEADLISLAHSILKMKNKDDVFALKEQSKVVYEKLSLLAFVEEYVNVTPNLEVTKEELVEKVTIAIHTKETKVIENKKKEEEKVVFNLEEESVEEVLEESAEEEVKKSPNRSWGSISSFRNQASFSSSNFSYASSVMSL